MSAAKKKRTAIGYVRVSVDGIDKVSPDMQRRAIEEYCERKSWPLADVVIERGRSAGRGKARPAFETLLDRLATGEADTLVVYKLDRLTRSTIDFADIRSRLAEGGTEFVSVTEEFDTTTAMGRAMVSIVVTFAELERDMLTDRVKEAHRQKRHEGRGTTGTAAYGYRHDDHGRLVVESTEAEWLHRMAEWLIAGDSLRAISKRLTAEGAPTPPRGNGRWNHGAVRSLLLNRHMIAERFDPDTEEWVKAPWAAIFSADEFATVTAVLKDPARRTSHTKQRHLLSGIATCGKCGARLYPHTRDGVRRYRCLKSDKAPDACQGIAVKADPLDELVVAATLTALAGIDVSVPTPAGDDAVELQAQLDELATAWGRSEISSGEWRAARAVLVERLDAVERAAPLSAPIVAMAAEADVPTAWELIDLDAQRAVLRDLWASIEIGAALTDRRDVAGRVMLTVAK
jgi:site-specific DNA recombinase